MKELNLLPRALRGASAARRRMFWLFGIGGACCLAALFFYGHWRVSVLEGELEAARLDRTLLEPVAARMHAIEACALQTARREAILEKCTRTAVSPYAVLVQLGAAAQEEARLTEVVVLADGMVVLRGRAPAYPTVAAFLEKLEENTLFQQPVLADSQAEEETGSMRFEMRMRCRAEAS